MSVNILDLAKSCLTNAAIDKLAGFLGENSSNVKSALDGIFPALLGGIMQNASTTIGAKEVLNMIQSHSDSSLLNDLPSILGNSEKTRGLLSEGSKILPLLLGNKVDNITSAISSRDGVKASSVSSLLGIAAPILLNVLGKQVSSSGIGLSGLTSLLMSQKNSVLAALPSGLSGLLNFSDLGDFKGNSERHHVSEINQSSKVGMPKWLPWLLAALVLLGLILGVKNCKKEETVSVEETNAAVDTVTSTLGVIADSLSAKIDTGLEKLGAFFKRRLPNGTELNIPEFGIENNLIKFIEDKDKPVDKTTWFNFDRITFETGSTKLSAESLEQTKNLSEILKAFPSVNLKIGGYTDNTGDSAINLKLSNERAQSVKEAIEKEGIGAGRIEAEGYGKEFPVATNDTEEGRAQNRRIAVRVTKK